MPSHLDDVFRRPLTLAVLWAACVVAMAVLVRHFWIPLDDGTLAQSAERVLRGQLPHRDFGDPYTGLNAMMGALAFRLFGVRLVSLRIPLVVGFALWLPALWLVSRRFLAPTPAAAATLLAAVLSVPTYPAAMPTWFGLFAVTWGLWFLLGALEGNNRWWLLAAGAAAGVSLLFKVTGLYFLAAAFLSVTWRRIDGTPPMLTTAVAGVLLFVALLARIVLPGSGPAGAYQFFLPSLVLGLALVVRASRLRQTAAPSAAGDVLLDITALTLGVFVPVALFLVPYAASHAMTAWYREVFLLPTRRFVSAASPPGAPWTVLPGVVAVAVAGMCRRLRGSAARRGALALAAFLAVGLAVDDATGGAVVAILWYSGRAWIPALTVWAALVLVPARAGTPTFAVVATAALWSLVQFPYTAPAYFFYAAPLGVVATGAVLALPPAGADAAAGAGRGVRAGPVLTLLAAIYAYLGAGYAAGVALSGTTPLDVDRGGLLVSEVDARTYRAVVGTVQAHVDSGGLWAGPDAPEVYFLSGRPNPTPTLYEFLDPRPVTPGALSEVFDNNDVRVAVLNTRPLFSPPLDAGTTEHIMRTFPEGRTVGPFVIRWRAADGDSAASSVPGEADVEAHR